MKTSTIEVCPTDRPIGADIEGVDLSRPMDSETFSAIAKAWLDHLVLRFRNQNITDPELIDFSNHFGKLDLAPITVTGEREIPEYPQINVMSNVLVNGKAIGSLGSYEAEWHTDMSYVEEPPKMSCLFALEVPPSGGNTSFLNMYGAYDTLSVEVKKTIDGRQCKHDASRNSAGELRKGYAEVTDPREAPGALHPLVRTHPETRKQALFLGRRRNAYIVGLPLDESEELLNLLWNHSTTSDLRWDQVWQKGDLIMWDNRCAMHRRDAFDPNTRRIMHRTQVQGDRPF